MVKKKSFISLFLSFFMIIPVIFMLAACDNGKSTLDNLQNEYGVVVDGGGFKQGSILVSEKVELTSDEGQNVLDAIKDQEYNKDGDIYIYDISVFLDGTEVQPNGNVKVTLPAPSEIISEYVVFHIKNSGCEKLSSMFENGKISFETSSFSYFVIATEEEKAKVNFLAQCDPYEGGYITENGSKVDFGNGRQVEQGTQITLNAVANYGYIFKGWGTRDANWNLTIISTEATHTFTVTEDTYVQAIFKTKVTSLELDAHNAGFTYGENDKISDKTVVTIGAESTPNPEYVLVYGVTVEGKTNLTKDTDYTIDLGGLDFTKEGLYTITYTYKEDTSIKATLKIEVVKPADGSLTEEEWNEAMSYWASQTNVKVVSSYASNDGFDDLGAQIMIYQFNGTAFSEDGGFENDPVDYKGKASYLVKEGDTYSTFNCWDDENWYKQTNESVKEEYDWSIENQIYACRDFDGNKIDFSYAKFSFDATTKTYKNSDGSITIAFTFDNDKLTKIVVTVVLNDEGNIRTNVNTITFGDAVVDVPTDFIIQ